MLAESRNAALYAEWFDYIDTQDARNAFCLLVGKAATLHSCECHPQWKGKNGPGPIRDFRFMRKGEQPFSFTSNKSWLLFYFRKPAVESGLYSLKELQEAFASTVENPRGEWTVKLKNESDVNRLWAILDLE